MQHCVPLTGSPCGHIDATWLRHGQHRFAWGRTGRACKIAGAASVPSPREPNDPGDNTSPSSQQEHSSAQDSGDGIGARVKRFFLGAVGGGCPSAFRQTMPLNAPLSLLHLHHILHLLLAAQCHHVIHAGDKMDKDRLAKLGLGAVASYGELHASFYQHGPPAGWMPDLLHRSAAVYPASSQVGAFYFAGFVSNLTYGIGLSLSWIAFVHQSGGSRSALELRAAISAFFAPGSYPVLM